MEPYDSPFEPLSGAVLLVEDNPGDARLVMETLRDEPTETFQMLHADRLSVAEEMVQRHDIGCVLLDLGLPDANGLQAVQRLRQVARSVPIIVLSGQNDRDIAVNAVQQGAEDYLIKGEVDPDRLVRSLRYAVERKRTERARSDFVSAMTHELRTPLTSIIGYVELLEDALDEQLTDRTRSMLDVVSRNAQRMLTLSEDLLVSSRIEAGTLTFSRSIIDLQAVLESVHDTLAPMADAKSVGLAVDYDIAGVRVSGDIDQLERVFLNLMNNAIKFTPPGGNVKIRAARDGGCVTVEVTDTGIGIAADEVSKLFEQFYRAGSARDAHIQGTGLGLSIVRGIVEQHGGKVSVQSVLGDGTTFTVELPLTIDESQAHPVSMSG